jgi:hypothetical protein
MPGQYNSLSTSTKALFVSLPLLAIELSMPGGRLNMEIGNEAEINQVSIQFHIQELSRVRLEVLSQYIFNRIKNKRILIYDFNKQYPNPSAEVRGYLDMDRPRIRFVNMSNISANLKWGGIVTCVGKWVN